MPHAKYRSFQSSASSLLGEGARRHPAKTARGIVQIFALAVLSILTLAPGTARAQLYAGSLEGVVKDPSGALVVGAAVTLTDVDRGFVHQDKTDSSGHYQFRGLAPTVYKLSVSNQGFETEEVPSIVINVNENAAHNVTLKVGSSASVEVTGTFEGVDTQDGSTGQVVDRSLISNLPLINRQVFDLAYLAPGVSPPAGGTFGPGGQANNFISEGSRNAQADILIDGVTTTNYDQNTGFVDPLYTPSVDAVQEFKIQQTNFSAEFGFSGATVINVVTRSGSNSFHGSLYEYLRNTVLNSENYFAKEAGQPNPPYHQNDFGGTFSGPIFKDKLFFFFDYEGIRQNTPQTDTLSLPTAAERTGDFGQVCTQVGGSFNGSGQCSVASGQIWDPFQYQLGTANQHTSTVFVPFNNFATYASQGNFVGGTLKSGAGNLIDPTSVAILKYIPLPNNGTQLNNNYIKTATNVANEQKVDIKLDYQLTQADNFSGRFSYDWHDSEDANLFGNAFDSNTQGPTDGRVYQGSLNYAHTFNSNTLLTTTLGVTHSWAHTQGVPFDGTQVGMPADLATNPVDGIQTAPSIEIDGYASENSNGTFGGQEYSVLLYGQDVAHLEGTLSKVIHNHELKVGGEVRLHRINFTQWGIPNGRYEYNSGATSQDANNSGSGGDSYASYITGLGTGWDSYQDPAQPATQNWQYAGFFQDNWRARPNLTFNLGFRYDLDMPRTERHDRMSYWDPTIASPFASLVSGVDPAVCAACNNLRGAFEYVGGGNSRYPYNVYHGAVGPRVGFSYVPRPNTSIRGGAGIYYAPGKTGAAGTGAGGAGFQGYATQTTWQPYVGTAATGYNSVVPNYQAILGMDPGTPQLPYGKSQGLATELGNQLAPYIPVKTFNALPREFSWSLGIEHQFASKFLLDADYVGKHGQHLYLGGFNNYLDHISSATAAAYRVNPGAFTGFVNVPQALSVAVGQITVPITGSYGNPVGPTTTGGGTWPAYNGFLPYPQFAIGAYGDDGVQTTDPPVGRSNYHGLVVKVSRPMLQSLQLLATYTAQQSFDNGSSQGSNFYITPNNNYGLQDPNDIDAEYALSAYSVGQIAQFTTVYKVPFGKNMHWTTGNNVLDTVFGGWVVDGSYRWDSGQPITVGGGGQATMVGYGSRPNLNGQLKKRAGVQGVDVGGNIRGGGYFANPGVFTEPVPYADGTSPRTLQGVTAPGTDNFNFAADKNFLFQVGREHIEFKLRYEAFNLFNHVQFAGPGGVSFNGTAGSTPISIENGGNFGVITGQANQPRIQQISARISF
jgi:hypothetical protein